MLNNFIIKYYAQNITPALLILLSTFLWGCKTFDAETAVKRREIPRAYPVFPSMKSAPPLAVSLRSDSTTIADMQWRAFFRDSLLTALIDTALQNNFTLQIALQRIESAQAQTTFTRGELLPKVFANAGAGIRKFGLYTMDGAGNISTEILPGKIVPIDLPDFNLGLQTSWELDVWGKLRNKNEAALAGYLASVEATRFVATSLIAEIAGLYYDLLELDLEQDIIRQTLLKQKEALNVIQLQKEAGKANELAVQQFEAQIFGTQALEREIAQQIVVRENMLNFLLGRFPQPIARRKESLFAEPPESVAYGIPSQLLQNRPDIREAEFLVQASRYEVEAAKAAFLPSFTITAGAGFQAFDPAFLFLTPASIAYNALGGLVAPLFNWNALEAQQRNATAEQVRALTQYQQKIVNAYMEVANELFHINNLRDLDSLKLQQRNVLQESVDIATELYKSAKATYLEILLAQQSSLQAQLELMQIKKRRQIALVNLYKALGGGWR